MKMWLGPLMGIVLTACADQPVVTSVDTLCVETTRYHATDEQRAQFGANQPLWEPLVNWLAEFNATRDKRCN